MTYMLHSAGMYDFRRPDRRDVCIEDIAFALAGLRRFQGRGHSVAWHLLDVASDMDASRRTPLDQLYGLCHDMHEAYTGDINGVFKEMLPTEVHAMEMAVQNDVLKRLGIPAPTEKTLEVVRRHDQAVLMTELQYMAKHPGQHIEEAGDVSAELLDTFQLLKRKAGL